MTGTYSRGAPRHYPPTSGVRIRRMSYRPSQLWRRELSSARRSTDASCCGRRRLDAHCRPI